MFSIAPEVLAQPVGDDLVLMDLRTSRYYSLNAVAADLWRALEKKQDPSQIRRELQARYDVDAKALAADVDRTLRDLIDAGLVSDQP